MLNISYLKKVIKIIDLKMNLMPESDSEDELPPGWEESASDEGFVCFINRKEEITQWIHPRTGRSKRVKGELPLGWERKYDEQLGRFIFYNKNTKQTTFADPRLAFATEIPPNNVSQIRQRFDASSTALQVLHGKDLNGRLAIVTGANSGIGFETARSLVLHGCKVIFACRNKSSTEEAIQRIISERPVAREQCHYVHLDLGSFASVQLFVEQIKKTINHIDMLILNAGVFALPYSTTLDGIETTFQISHLSHFYLTLQLEEKFNHTTRIVILSSESHRFSNLVADNLSEQHLSPTYEKYWSMMAYNNAKLCNVLFAKELANRWKGRGICVYALHPGNMVSSNIQRNWWFYRLLFALVRPFTKSLQQAAATTVYCATANELTGVSGYYFNNCFFCQPSKLAQSQELSQKLWKLSEQMVQRIVNDLKMK